MRTDELGTPDGLPRQNFDLARFEDVLRADPCAYCGGVGGTVDHIAPIGKSAPRCERSAARNGTSACRACNNAKADYPLLHFLLGEHRQVRPASRTASGRAVLANRATADPGPYNASVGAASLDERNPAHKGPGGVRTAQAALLALETDGECIA
jgi:hypothetical protein